MTSDPVTTFDHLGNGYFTLLTRGPTGLDMLKKPVGGDWQLPVVVDRTTYTDKQWIMGDQDPQGISPYAGYLYMSWTDVSSPSRIVFSRSTDSNSTWTSAPSACVRQRAGFDARRRTGRHGLCRLWSQHLLRSTGGRHRVCQIHQWRRLFHGPVGRRQHHRHPLVPARTLSTFRTPASLPAFAVSPANGNLYVAWADYRHGDADIYFTRSADGGCDLGHAGSTERRPYRQRHGPVPTPGVGGAQRPGGGYVVRSPPELPRPALDPGGPRRPVKLLHRHLS